MGGKRSAGDAQTTLEAGNRRFSDGPVASAARSAHGSPEETSAAVAIPAQEPFAAVIGCADARAPISLLFDASVNDLFVVRVAGNVLGDEVIGSIDYALQNLPTVSLVVVIGHSGCGAVSAAVRAYRDPATLVGLTAEHQLRTIVHHIYPAVHLANQALVDVHGAAVTTHPGFDEALIDVAVVLNAAVNAASLRSELAAYSSPIETRFGVYDLRTGLVGLPRRGSQAAPTVGLIPPAPDAADLMALALDLAAGVELV